jgi:hypothetical protein
VVVSESSGGSPLACIQACTSGVRLKGNAYPGLKQLFEATAIDIPNIDKCDRLILRPSSMESSGT